MPQSLTPTGHWHAQILPNGDVKCSQWWPYTLVEEEEGSFLKGGIAGPKGGNHEGNTGPKGGNRKGKGKGQLPKGGKDSGKGKGEGKSQGKAKGKVLG